MDKTQNNRAWLLVLPVFVLVAFSAIIPLMTVVNYAFQDILGPQDRVWVGMDWFRQVMEDDALRGALYRQLGFSFAVLLVEMPLGIALALAMPARGCRRLVDAGADGPAAADPLERGRHHLADLRPRRHRACRLDDQPAWPRLQLHQRFARRLAHHPGHGRVALDVAGGPALLCRPARHPRRLLPGGRHRRRVALGRVPLHRAAEDAAACC